MDNKTNRLISLAYQLYDTTDGEHTLVEQTAEGRPFTFISGMGIALDAFEKQMENLSTGDNFDFTLAPEDAYGAYEDCHVIDLAKEMFVIDGRFDAEHVRKGAIIPLQNEDGNRFNGVVVEVTADKVKVDLNHPLAGRTLTFKGSILEAHEATNEEIQAFVESLQGNGDGEGCGHCNHEGGCHNHEGGCNHKGGCHNHEGGCKNHGHGDKCHNHEHGGDGHCHCHHND